MLDHVGVLCLFSCRKQICEERRGAFFFFSFFDFPAFIQNIPKACTENQEQPRALWREVDVWWHDLPKWLVPRLPFIAMYFALFHSSLSYLPNLFGNMVFSAKYSDTPSSPAANYTGFESGIIWQHARTYLLLKGCLWGCFGGSPWRNGACQRCQPLFTHDPAA